MIRRPGARYLAPTRWTPAEWSFEKAYKSPPSGTGVSSATSGQNSRVRQASLAKYQPRLQSIFGWIDQGQDEYLRGTLAKVDSELSRIARHFGRDSRGLQMNWYESGQMSISGDVGTSDSESHAVDFIVELRPSWMHEEPSRTNEWVIETEIYVDCQHMPDHGSMDNVYDRIHRQQTPEGAVDQLLDAARQLVALATDHPVEYWASKAKSQSG
jgi:hypothetical protein